LTLQNEYRNIIQFSETGFAIQQNKRTLARLIAKVFDQYINLDAKFSAVS
jgi:hypothetical protein